MRVDTATLIDKFSDRIRWDDLDLESFAAQPLDDETLRCLRYMHDVEFHTICYLRDLLLTPAHGDASVTGFLSLWVYQEYWHGEAIAAVLDAHGELSGMRRVQAVRNRLGLRDRLRPLLVSLGGWIGGDDFTAVHMAWGAVNEWTTQAGYAQLAQRAGHPVLSELLKRIMKQEGRHIDFYASQAQRRLSESRRAQRITRMALGKFWGPVGSGVMPNEEVAFLSRYLFAGERGQAAAARIDRQVDRLPGMSGLALMRSATSSLAA
ncbi:MAG: ferritin-like domain-containing protein [Acidimicrobiales bacterium]